jgi:hypothetical protein
MPSRKGKQSRQAAKRAPDENEMVAIDYNRLRTLTSVIHLDTINLIESAMTSFLDARRLDGSKAMLDYGVQLADAAWARQGSQLDAYVAYVISARMRDDSKTKELFRVTARFLVGYRVPEDLLLDAFTSSDVMADFVVANGQINAFPYVRQLVADQTARAGWPPLQLDVLRAPAKRRRDFVRELAFGAPPQTALAK